MKSDTVSVLKSGWGTFLLVAGVISLILDFAVPSVRLSSGESFPIFRGDSFTLGWFFIVGILIIPAALTRHFGAAPINAVMALIWCIAGFIAWVVLHSIIAGFDPSKPMRPNLALIGGLILCWRLLVTPKSEQPGIESEVPVSDEAAQETASSENECPSSPAKVSLQQERQNTHAVVEFQVPTNGLGDAKKKIIGAGVLIILIVSMILAHTERESPSIGWMLALSASWGISVWLLPEGFITKVKATFSWKRLRILALTLGIVFCAVWVCEKGWPRISRHIHGEPLLLEEDAQFLTSNFDQFPAEKQAEAKDWLRRYKDQQDKLGLPLFPAQEAKRLEEERAFTGMFDSPDKIDYQPPYYSDDPKRDKMQYANMALLSRAYQKQPLEIATRYEFYLNDYSRQKFHKPETDTAAFYADAGKEIKRQQGQPLFPSEAKQQANEADFFAMFDNVKNVDPTNGIYDVAERFKPGEGDRLRMREAGMRFLAKQYGDAEKVRRDFPLYRDDFAMKNGGKRGMNEREFYVFAGQFARREKGAKIKQDDTPLTLSRTP